MKYIAGRFPTPILFLVFNRPETTAKVFETIRIIKPCRLYIAGDGPRKHKAGEAERVAKVREILAAVDWPCEVKTLYQAENLGCKYAVSGAITWFFKQEDYGIILEDDCLPSQSFFWFCHEMLDKYKNDHNIFSVRGTNISPLSDKSISYYFSNHTLPWGWASWARAWDKCDLYLNSLPEKKCVRHLKSLKVGGGVFFSLIFSRILKNVKEGKIDTWDYQWIYSCWLNHGLTIAPVRNLIRNIGYSNDATHTTGYHPILSNLQPNELDWPLKEPLDCAPNSEADDFISKHWFGVSWKSFVKSLILRFPGVAKVNQVRKQYIEKNY